MIVSACECANVVIYMSINYLEIDTSYLRVSILREIVYYLSPGTMIERDSPFRLNMSLIRTVSSSWR